MAKTKYPKWFNHYVQPKFYGTKAEKKITKTITLKILSYVNGYETIAHADIPKDVTHIK